MVCLRFANRLARQVRQCGWVLTLLAMQPLSAYASVQVIGLGGHMAWHLATGDLTRTGTHTIIVGTYDGHVLNVDASGAGSVVWDYDTGSPSSPGSAIFDVSVGDLVGDAQQEVVVASADGAVYALSAAGALLWKVDLKNGNALQAKIAHLNGASASGAVVVSTAGRTLALLSPVGAKLKTISLDLYPRYLRVGNFAGDDKDTIFVASSTRTSGRFALQVFGPNLTTLSSLGSGLYPPFSAPEFQYGFDYAVAPAPSGDRDHLVTPYGTAAYGANLLLGPTLGISFNTAAAAANFPTKNISYTYRSEQVATGELTSSPGLETVTVDGPDLALYAAGGQVLGGVQVGNPNSVNVTALNPGPVQPRGFTDAAFLPSAAGEGRLVLGSSPNGDDNLYVIRFTSNWQSELKTLRSPAGVGVDAQTQANLKAVADMATAWSGAPAAGQPGPFPYSVSFLEISPGSGATRGAWAVGSLAEYAARYPRATYPRLEFVAEILGTVDGAGATYPGGPWPKDRRYAYDLTEADIRAYAEYMEGHHAKFWLWSGHGNQPYLSLATIENVFKTYAPTACLGLIQSETENLDYVVSYVQQVLKPQLGLAKKYKKQMVFREKNAFWGATTAIPEVGNVLLGSEFSAVVVPSVEESNTRTPDLNFAARVGAWLDGQVDHWDSHVAPDWFRFDVMDSTAYPLSGHWVFRYLVAEAVMGSSSYSQLFGAGVPRIDEGLDPFLKLVGKGIIVPPNRAQVRGVSPIIVRVRRTQSDQPSTRFVASGTNGHHMAGFNASDDGPATAWAFGQQDCYWGLSKTALTDAASYLWNRKNQFDNHIPPTPHGFVALVSAPASASDFPWSNLVWETDGDQMYRQGIGFGANAAGQMAARTAMLADLKTAATALPMGLSGDEVFAQVVQQSTHRYILYLVDPGLLTPQERHVTVSLQGEWTVADRLAQSAPKAVGTAFEVVVPAGSIRIFELTQTGGASDAGTGLDAGIEIDAGQGDLGDAGVSQIDAGSTPDVDPEVVVDEGDAGGTEPMSESLPAAVGGCGCSGSNGAVSLLALGVLLLAFGGRRACGR